MTSLSETLLIIITIMGLCLLFAWLDSRDAKLELAELKKDKLKVCEIHQYNAIHQFECVQLGKHLVAKF